MPPATNLRSLADIEAERWGNGSLAGYAFYSEAGVQELSIPKWPRKIPWKGGFLIRHQLGDADLAAFRECLDEAKGKRSTRRDKHLILGELGERFASIIFGIKLHADPCAKGSDGMIGSELVEVKTITPGKGKNFVEVKRAGDFSLIAVVKITSDFQMGARLVDRSLLPKDKRKLVRLSWNSMLKDAGEYTVHANRAFPFSKPGVQGNPRP